MRAWHFCIKDGDRILTNKGRLVVTIGETIRHEGKLKMCFSGLHASVRAIDALSYAQGNIACRVECGGEIVRGDDKIVCSERTVLWAVDAEATLRHFARLCALDVLPLWPDPPEVVVRFLRTGDESIRDAARVATWDAAWDAARAATMDAAWDAARDAARAAAWDAAMDAAWDAAMDAARDAAMDAAWAAAWDAALERANTRLTRMLSLTPRI
jgi:hypothetical protein